MLLKTCRGRRRFRPWLLLILLVLALRGAMAQTPPDPDVTTTIAELRQPDPRVRVDAAISLGNMAANGSPNRLRDLQARAAAPLLDALAHGDPALRKFAAFALGNFVSHASADLKADDLRMQPVLVAALRDPAAPVRAGAALALGAYRENGGAAVPGLVAALHDPEDDVREGAAEALGNIGEAPEFAVPALAAALKESVGQMAGKTAKALAQFGPKATAAIPALVAMLSQPESGPRYFAAIALAGMGPQAQPAVPALLAALQDHEGYVRLEAAAGLAAAGQRQEAGLVVAMRELLDPDADNRIRAAGVIGEFGAQGAPALRDLGKALADREEDVRHVASIAIGRIAAASKEAGRTDAIADLKDDLATMSRSDDTAAQTSAPQLAEAVSALETMQQQDLRYRLSAPFRKWPLVASIILGYIVLAAGCFALLLARPLFVLLAAEALAGLPALRLPGWLGGVEVSPANLLLVGFLKHNSRVLDAWVERAVAKLRYNVRQDAVIGPVSVDGRVLADPTPDALGQTPDGRPARLLLVGDKGWAEKMVEAIAQAAMAREPRKRFYTNIMVPLRINKNLLPPLDTDADPLVSGLRELLPAQAGAPSDSLMEVLLRRQRILPIVMDLAERDEATRVIIARLCRPGVAAGGLVATSTREETLDNLRFTKVEPA